MVFRPVFALLMLATAGLAQAESVERAGPGDAKAGEAKSAVCAACHAADGNSAIAMYPKLAGQNEAYIARQLAQFKSGQRDNAIMAPFAATLSAQDMNDLGAFFASKLPTSDLADSASVERAQQLYRAGDAKLGVPACMACHGPDGRGMAGSAYPQLAGQWADYVQAKLTEWRGDVSWGDDEHAKIMPEIAKRLSDKDIADLASYAQGLHTADAAK
ncbi:c-type cytochrome [Dokdonella sp.]|uniref:c-type cytochrome n=1 Tax=Dokdonella sp. TaxID=2291710 RepID=UPI0025C3943A|nr:c-type cytochrome [Dokdonella sp.]MBX3691812.1 cytochrome c4 [Dokdonella sp.]MCW5568706.1 cytochrome c4 [Dokdonella sp.]